MEKLPVRLSNLMAFDADAFGNWGCSPRLYPEVVREVLGGAIDILSNIEEHPLEDINELLSKKCARRPVLLPS
jgi:6-hydroxycyclohex-1-ene-1-carbonyl-CoA dehydrogenase